MSIRYLFSEVNEYLYKRSKNKAVRQTTYDVGQAQGCPPSVGDLRMFPSHPVPDYTLFSEFLQHDVNVLSIPLGGVDMLPTLPLPYALPRFECALVTHRIFTRVGKMGEEVSGAAISNPVRRFAFAGGHRIMS